MTPACIKGGVTLTNDRLPPSAGKVTLRGFPDGTGKSTYHQWLALARAKQVRQLLMDFGVPEERLSVEGSQTGALRQVRILMPGS